MKRIDFKNFAMFVGIDKANTVKVDIRKDFADFIYRNANGIMAQDLALRIYKSDAPVELNDDEFNFLEGFAKGGTPAFYDSFIAAAECRKK